MALITVPAASITHACDMCEDGSGLTSVTTHKEEEKSTLGVSLKNTLSASNIPSDEVKEPCYTPTMDEVLSDDFHQPEGYHWYFLRVSYNRAGDLYDTLKDRKDGYLLWMPCQKVLKYVDNKKTESLVPFFKSNIFIYSTYNQAFALTHRSPKTGYDYVDFAYDHTNKNQYGRDNEMIVRFSEMINFIKAERVHHPWAHLVSDEEIHYRKGGLVKVVGGSFDGVIGKVARVFGQTRVIVTIKGIVNYATAYVSQKYLQPLDEQELARKKEQEALKPDAGNSLVNRVKRHEVKVGFLKPDPKDIKKNKKKLNNHNKK